VHGYWNVDQSKMSKSLGNVVRPLDLKDKYGLDPFRYFLLRDMVFGLDSSFSEEAFVQRINSDLANDLGNLESRIRTMAVKFCQGSVPEPERTAADRTLPEAAQKALAETEAAFAELAMHKALIAIWEFINTVNRCIVASEPWRLAKNPADRGRLMTVIYDLLESLRVTAVLISPFMPGTAGKILERIGVADAASQVFATIRTWGGLAPGSPFKRGEALFPRVEFKGGEKALEGKEEKMEPLKPEISYEDFEKVDLRAARILSAEPVPKSSKLVKLRIDIGEERTIVAGIAKDYRPEDLVGKSIVVVANLKPTKLMGVESRGMLLATDAVEGLTLIGFDKPPKTGAKVR